MAVCAHKLSTRCTTASPFCCACDATPRTLQFCPHCACKPHLPHEPVRISHLQVQPSRAVPAVETVPLAEWTPTYWASPRDAGSPVRQGARPGRSSADVVLGPVGSWWADERRRRPADGTASRSYRPRGGGALVQMANTRIAMWPGLGLDNPPAMGWTNNLRADPAPRRESSGRSIVIATPQPPPIALLDNATYTAAAIQAHGGGTPLVGAEADCVVCYSQRADQLFMPCKHLVACSTCCGRMGIGGPVLVACPVCRSVVVESISVFRG